MSKELVISAASHERRVAILEEGQLVEIYIEREKEFALVGSIYKGRVTRVLPGMQSAFVDIGLDGDAFLYVSDVFENLEDYDHGQPHTEGHPQPAAAIPATGGTIEALPGETLSHAHTSEPATAEAAGEDAHPEVHADETHHDESHEIHHHEAHEANGESLASEEHEHAAAPEDFSPSAESHEEAQPESIEEDRQPTSNASAPQNFSHQYNPTQKYGTRSDRGNERSDRSGQDYGRGGDRDRGNDRGRGRWGRRGGGRRRGGRPGGPGGRNLPPSKYASPQGDQQRSGESRGYEQRGPSRGYDNRRQEGSRSSGPASNGPAEEPVLLPGESLAKYRGKPSAAPSAPVAEPESRERQPELSESGSRPASSQPASGPGPNIPRRSSGLPRWVLAESGPESEAAAIPAEEAPIAAEDTASSIHEAPESVHSAADAEPAPAETPLSDEEVTALSSSLIEAKQDQIHEHAKADALAGGAEFEEEEEDELEVEAEAAAEHEHHEELHAAPGIEASDEHIEEESDEAEELLPHEHASAAAEADAAHEEAHAEHVAASERFEGESFGHEPEHINHELAAPSAPAEEESGLLPGETRSPRVAGAPREDFAPRDSARIGGNPRSRFQRPYRSGGRDRGGRDSRGRSDRRGGGRGPRFERRPGAPRHDRGGYQRSGPPRRPQLISEMLKAGQDVVIQIAKEPLGKKGARITSHVALPGRFLVYMPTVHHTGVSRKIVSAENRSRLRRLVSEASQNYPGGFIVRTAAGGATDDEIRADIEFLGKTWNEIKERSEQRKAPALLHRDLDLVERMLRDYVSDDFSAIWIDSEEEYGKVVEFISRFQPKLVNRVKLYTKETPIFEEFGIQHELDKALRAKVWLKSGGYIVINHTEALVAIDVNTGKFVGKGSTRLEDTIVKTNLEAVKEIVRQIRLRDLGGIIVVDFIDMEERRNREKVLSALQMALEQDKAPSKALSFNEFGLVCITRKRTKQALERVLCQPCPYCTGSGMVKSTPTLCYEIQSEARKMALADHENPNLTLRVHPEIAKALKTRESMLIDELEQTTHKHVIIQSDATLHWEQYDIY
jgi:ribonuclease G